MGSPEETQPFIPIPAPGPSSRGQATAIQGTAASTQTTFQRWISWCGTYHQEDRAVEETSVWSLLRLVGVDRSRRLWGPLTSIAFCLILERAMRLLLPLASGRVVTALLFTPSEGAHDVWMAFLQWLVLLYVNDTILSFVRNIATSDLQEYMDSKLQIATHRHLMGLSADFHDKNSVPDSCSHIRSGGNIMTLLGALVFDVIPTVIDLAVGSIILWSRLGGLAFATGSLTSLFLLLWSMLMTRRTQQAKSAYHEEVREGSRVMYRSLTLWYEATISNCVSGELELFAHHVQAKEVASRTFTRSMALQDVVSKTIRFIGLITLCVIVYHAWQAGLLSAGECVTAIEYWNSLMSPLSSLIQSFRKISISFTELQELAELLSTTPTVCDSPSAKTLDVSHGRVELKEVSFAYSGNKLNTLSNISAVFPAGLQTAIVGESGSGKSTILNLLVRLYDVSHGSILIDGQPIQNVLLASLSDSVGLMRQKPMLFKNSIIENVRFGCPKAKWRRVRRACKAAGIHKEICRMEKGYKTTVEADGANLSGGQQQRIAMARLFLRNPQIILLDEATSALDSKTEARIQASLEARFANKTRIIVTHHQQTAKRCDHILVMHNGQIVEQGSHDDLLALGGQYTSLWAAE